MPNKALPRLKAHRCDSFFSTNALYDCMTYSFLCMNRRAGDGCISNLQPDRFAGHLKSAPAGVSSHGASLDKFRPHLFLPVCSLSRRRRVCPPCLSLRRWSSAPERSPPRPGTAARRLRWPRGRSPWLRPRLPLRYRRLHPSLARPVQLC